MFLRFPTSGDFAEFTALNKASRKFHRNLVNPPTDEKSFADFLKRSESETDRCFLICRNEDGAIVGGAALSQIFRKAFQNAYLGYYLAEKYTGKGYMTEAVKLVLRFAFRELKLHRVEANVQPENTASIAVLQRCGFTREGFSRKYLKIGGRWRDHARFAIIIEDWKAG
ncbi:MAG: GNAT family N-acetyltransferase [Acidobacteriota bacterium]|nr:GNAT family N-acetyltransferase [Acidobacteriota bacterium]